MPTIRILFNNNILVKLLYSGSGVSAILWDTYAILAILAILGGVMNVTH